MKTDSVSVVGYALGATGLIAGGLVVALAGGHSWAVYTGAGFVLSGAAVAGGSFIYDLFRVLKTINQKSEPIEDGDSSWLNALENPYPETIKGQPE